MMGVKQFSRTARNLALVAVALGSVTLANAATITSNIATTGTMSGDLSATGTVDLNSASGTFKQWVLFSHVNIGVSASPQTVGLTQTTPTAVGPLNGGGTFNLQYDNFTPGTPLNLIEAGSPHAIDLDLNGATNVPLGFVADPISISTSLGSFDLVLTFNGQISDFDFVSNASSAANPFYTNTGDFKVTIGGTVTGQLVGVPIIGNVNLGTITTLSPTDLMFGGGILGQVALTDLDGGYPPPYPHDMQANFSLNATGLSIPVPLSEALNVNQSASIPNGQSGFSQLNVDATLNATITLADIIYSYTGQVNDTLVPEPTSFVLFSMVGLGLACGRFRRRRNG